MKNIGIKIHSIIHMWKEEEYVYINIYGYVSAKKLEDIKILISDLFLRLQVVFFFFLRYLYLVFKLSKISLYHFC